MATNYIEKKQYCFLERNYRCRYGEIDIIACHQEYLVFCEVKTRKESLALQPSLSVNQGKNKRIRELVGWYLMNHEG